MQTTLEAESLGFGVQSSAIHLLAEEGKIDRFEVAFHGDTKSDGAATEEHKHKLKRASSIPVVEVSDGNLMQDVLDGLANGTRFASLPTWCIGEDGREAMIARQCTNDYKIQPVRRAIRAHLGYGPHDRVKEQVYLSIGFSTDEKERMRESEVNYIINEFPLIDLWWHRGQCQDYLADKGFKDVPKSSCIMCPFRTNSEWRRLRADHKGEWDNVCEFDEKIRHQPKLKQEQFLHRSLRPLADADLTSDDDQQMNLFCGMACGL